MFSKLVLNNILLYYCASSVVGGSNTLILDPNRDVLLKINRMTVEIMSQCYRKFKEIVVYCNSNDSVIKSLQDIHQFNVIVSNKSPDLHHDIPPRSRVNVILAQMNDLSRTSATFTIPNDTSLLDVNDPYFILDRTDSKCRIADPILQLLWKMKLVNLYVLCVDKSERPLVITYNPYINIAPRSWRKPEYNDMKSDKWTLFFRVHNSVDRDICVDLEFDRLQYIASRSFVDRLSVNSRLFAFIVFLAIVSNIEFLSFLDHLGILPFWRMITNSQHHSIANIFNDSGKQSNN